MRILQLHNVRWYTFFESQNVIQYDILAVLTGFLKKIRYWTIRGKTIRQVTGLKKACRSFWFERKFHIKFKL